MPTLQLYVRDDLLDKWIISGRTTEEMRIFLISCLEEEVSKG